MDDQKRVEYNYQWKLVSVVEATVLPVTIILSLSIVMVEAGVAMEIKLGMVDYLFIFGTKEGQRPTRHGGFNAAAGGFEDKFGAVIRILTERSPLNLEFVA